MQFEKDNSEIDLGYPIVPAGQYVWLIEDVALIVNDETGSKGYRHTLVVDEPVDGDAKAVGLKGSWYVNVIKKDGGVNEMGAEQINKIVNMIGGLKYFQKFDGTDIDDEKLATAIGNKFSGKYLRGTHIIETYDDNDGNEKKRMNFLKFQAVKAKAKAAPKPEPETGDDWD